MLGRGFRVAHGRTVGKQPLCSYLLTVCNRGLERPLIPGVVDRWNVSSVTVTACQLLNATMSSNLYEILGIQADATPEQSMFLLSCYRFSFSQVCFQSEKPIKNGHFRHTLTAPRLQTRPRQRRGFVRRVPSRPNHGMDHELS